MRGQLKFIILKQIEEAQCSGYDLMQGISQKLGQKPSPGSVYPLLDEMSKERLIAKQVEGRKIIYSLTQKGKQELKRLNKTKDELFKGMEKTVRLHGMLFEEDVSPHLNMIKQLSSEPAPFTGVFAQIKKEVEQLKSEVFRLYTSKSLTKNVSKVRAILSKATTELRKLQ